MTAFSQAGRALRFDHKGRVLRPIAYFVPKRDMGNRQYTELANQVCPRLRDSPPQPEAESRNLGQTCLVNSVHKDILNEVSIQQSGS